MSKPGHTGIRRILHATRYSALGLDHAWRYEAAFRQELALAAVLLPLAAWISRDAGELLLLLAPMLLVLIVELLNSAIEATVDRIGAGHHDLSGRAKDLGSAAVALCLLLLLACWVTVLWPQLAWLRERPQFERGNCECSAEYRAGQHVARIVQPKHDS